MRRPQQVVDLKVENAYSEFHAWFTATGCPEEGIKEAWEVLKKEDHGEYNVTTRTLTDPEFAHTVTAMMKTANAEAAPPRLIKPLNPGEFAVEFEHRRLEPHKVDVWFRRGPAVTPEEAP
jgi:hypothetical protein